MPSPARPKTHDGVTRREILKRAAIAGGVAWAAPVIQSISTPAFAQGSSACPGCFWVKIDETACDGAGTRTCPDCTGGFPVPRTVGGGCPCVENKVTMEPCNDPPTAEWTLTLPPGCTFHGGYSKCNGPSVPCQAAMDNGDGTVTFFPCPDPSPPPPSHCISHIEFCYCCGV